MGARSPRDHRGSVRPGDTICGRAIADDARERRRVSRCLGGRALEDGGAELGNRHDQHDGQRRQRDDRERCGLPPVAAPSPRGGRGTDRVRSLTSGDLDLDGDLDLMLAQSVADGSARLNILLSEGERIAELRAGQSYFREAGVEHNVINANDYEFFFIETELR